MIIEIIVAAIIALMDVMVFIMIKKDPEKESASQLSEIEEILKKVLAQAENLPKATSTLTAEASGVKGPVGDAVAVDSEAANKKAKEVAALQEVVDEQKKKIQILEEENKSEEGAAVPDDGKLNELSSKIQTLEAQLKEYEIIEDDIADLSLFKEENISLKKELESLKGGAGASAEAEEEKPSGEAQPLVEDPQAAVDETVKAIAEEEEPEAAEPSAEAALAPNPIADDDPQAAIDKALAEAEEKETPVVEAAINPSEVTPEGSNFKESKVDKAEEYITDDILAEFSAAIDKEFGHATNKKERSEKKDKVDEKMPSEAETKNPQGAVDLAMKAASAAKEVKEAEATVSVDTDKMLEEMSALSTEAVDDSGNGLEESADLDKMAAEATNLTVK